MPHALMGGIAIAERDEAPRRQPESLVSLETKALFSRHIADHAEHKPECTKSVDATSKVARRYTNDGHVVQVIAGVHALARLRHGRQRVPVEEARDMYKALAMLEARATALNPRFVPDLHAWSGRRLCLSEAAKAEIRGEVADEGNDAGPVNVGYLLHVTDAERTKLKLWRVEAVDMTEADKVEKTKAADRERKQAGLRAKGIPPRGAEFARLSALHPGKGKTAIYDMIAKARVTR